MKYMPWWTEKEKKLADEAEEFVDTLVPGAEEAYWRKEPPLGVVGKIANKGYFAAGVPEKYGGMGLGATGVCIIAEQVGRLPIVRHIYACTMIGGVHQIIEFGTEEQKEKWLPRVARGELGAVSITEPFVGSDVRGIETVARREGDEYIIIGKKRFATNLCLADRYCLYARTSDDPEDIRRRRHLTSFIVEKGMKGFTVEKVNELIGYEGVYNGYLNLDEVHVPIENRIGEEGQGWEVSMSGLNFERITYVGVFLGELYEVLKHVIWYMQRRIQFGNRTIDFPTNQFKIADIITNLEIMRVYCYHAAHLLDLGETAALEGAIVKLIGSDYGLQSVIEAIQCMGGDGVTKFYLPGRSLGSFKIVQIGGGTNEIMRIIIYRMGVHSLVPELRKLLPRKIHDQLGVAVPVPREPRRPLTSIDHLISELAEYYRVNPGLYMSRDDLKDKFEVEDDELDKMLMSLEKDGLAGLYRNKRGQIELVKLTYEGLRRVHPPEYYRWFPPWVKREHIF